MDILPGPVAGRLLAPVVGYATRRAAKRQAERWNEALAATAAAGDGERYDVEVGPRDLDGTWKLVWRQRP